jgi:hypothetical protein
VEGSIRYCWLISCGYHPIFDSGLEVRLRILLGTHWSNCCLISYNLNAVQAMGIIGQATGQAVVGWLAAVGIHVLSRAQRLSGGLLNFSASSGNEAGKSQQQ